MSDYSSSEGEEDDPFQCLYETENEQEYLKQLNQEKSHGNKEGNSVFFVDESDDDEEAYTKPVITTEKKNHSFDVAKLHKCTVEVCEFFTHLFIFIIIIYLLLIFTYMYLFGFRN